MENQLTSNDLFFLWLKSPIGSEENDRERFTEDGNIYDDYIEEDYHQPKPEEIILTKEKPSWY